MVDRRDATLRRQWRVSAWGSSETIVFSIYVLIFTQNQSRWNQAEQCPEEMSTFAEGHHMALWLAWANAYRGWILARQGVPAKGIALIQKSLADLSTTRTTPYRPFCLALLAAAHRACGAFEDGLRVLDLKDAKALLSELEGTR